jgi:hypothetical protein
MTSTMPLGTKFRSLLKIRSRHFRRGSCTRALTRGFPFIAFRDDPRPPSFTAGQSAAGIPVYLIQANAIGKRDYVAGQGTLAVVDGALGCAGPHRRPARQTVSEELYRITV